MEFRVSAVMSHSCMKSCIETCKCSDAAKAPRRRSCLRIECRDGFQTETILMKKNDSTICSRNIGRDPVAYIFAKGSRLSILSLQSFHVWIGFQSVFEHWLHPQEPERLREKSLFYHSFVSNQPSLFWFLTRAIIFFFRFSSALASNQNCQSLLPTCFPNNS
jgi:hypothetical protein